MKPYLKTTLVCILISLAFTACKDLIEPNIKDRTLTLEAPGDKYQSASYNVNFWWDEVEDALTYRLQVVSPKFDSIGVLVMDTLVKKTKFSVNLNPGNYQWRVRAENGSSKTAYSIVRNFTIFQSSIKQQKVQLQGPASGTLTNVGNILLNWNSLYGATKYRLEIDTNNFANESAVVYNQALPGLQLNYTFPKDQVYQWRVRAENDTAQALWSGINSITYDHTPPAKVVLLSPANRQSLSLPVPLQWSGASSAVKYKVYVMKSDSTTLYNNTFPATVNTPGYSFNLGSLGEKVYWKITALDAAGNESVNSELRSFTIQ